jgi:ATPases of the AAA+ class
MENDISEIEILIRARYPILYIESYEEQRVIRQLNAIAETRNKQLILWSGTTGLINIEGSSVGDGTKDPIKALDFIETIETPTIVIYKDLHRYIDDIRVYRKVRDLHTILKGTMNTMIILAPVVNIPVELQKSISIISVPLPTANELDEVLTHVVACTSAGAQENTKIYDAVSLIKEELKVNKNEILNAGLGLTEDEFENVISRSIVEEHKLDPRIIISEKEQIIKKSGVLEFQTKVVGMDQVGGLNVLKDWIMKRKQAYTPEAKEYGLPVPKGVFITGPPGTGKSLTAKAAAAYLGVPLLRLDISKIFGSFVGQSEQNMSMALKMAEAVAPAVLWTDEIEKAMAGVQSSGTNDSGVTARVFRVS